MINNLHELPGYEQKDVARSVRYLDLKGVDPATYWIGRGGKGPDGTIACASFSDKRDDQANSITSLYLPVASEQSPLITGLPKALDYVVHLLSEPDALERLRRVDVNADDAQLLEQLGIDTDQACRSSVEAWAPGNFLAPDGDGFTYFLVEERGEVIKLAHSEALAPVAWAFAADNDMQRTNLHGRIGRTVSQSCMTGCRVLLWEMRLLVLPWCSAPCPMIPP